MSGFLLTFVFHDLSLLLNLCVACEISKQRNMLSYESVFNFNGYDFLISDNLHLICYFYLKKIQKTEILVNKPFISKLA